MSQKVSIIGAGNTGTITALLLAQRGLCDIVLLDIPELVSQAKGKALDLIQSTAVFNSDISIIGTDRYEDTGNSDVVIITAGITRKPGMSRNSLLEVNLKILSVVVKNIVRFSPDTILMILTNPVDVMTYAAYKISGLPRNKVIGQAGLLDTARYKTLIARELNVGVSSVTGLVLGVHGEGMVPLPRYTFVGGIPLEEVLTEDKINNIIEKTRHGGQEIIELLKNGSSYFAPASSLVEMVENILLGKKRIVPASVYLEGEYGYSDQVLGVPVTLGAGGIERIIELQLLPSEKEALDKSAAAIEEQLRNLSGLIEEDLNKKDIY